MGIDVSAVTAQFGAYYKPGSDNEKNLRNMLYQASQTAKLFMDMPSVDTIWRGTLAELERVVQPFQKAFTPIGDIVFTPNQFDLFNLKVDKSEFPDDLEATYLGFMASVADNERANWPFVRWLIEQHIIPKMAEDLELNEYFKGVYAAPGVGVAGAVSTAMNGLRKVIRDYNTAGKTNLGNGAIATGAWAADDADFCTQVEEYVEDHPSIFRSKIDHVIMSETGMRKYIRGKRKKYNINYAQVTDLLVVEDQPNVSVAGLISMEDSEMMFSTLKENRIRPLKKAELGRTLKVESLKREVFLFTNWWEALNFRVPQFLFHNDQDLA
jgi:hypothetical protein